MTAQISERRGICIVLGAPSGGGKTSVLTRLVADDPNIRQSISATTRLPREGEVHGRHYYFHSPQEFSSLVSSGGMLEHATVFGKSYGIPRAPVVEALEQGIDLVFAIDWQGHAALCEQLPGDVVGIYLLPPSREEIRSRLEARGDGKDLIESRMQQFDSELSHSPEFEHSVVNNDLDEAYAQVAMIIENERASRLMPTAVQAHL